LDAAKRFNVRPEIHQADFIYLFQEKLLGDREKAVNEYYKLGSYSTYLLKEEVLPEILRVKTRWKEKWEPNRILDFASGYGCVARHLPTAFASYRVTVSDIHDEALAFSSRILGIETYPSSSDPLNFQVPKQDLIIALSFFSHMPEAVFPIWLRALSSSLAGGGVLVFTTRGFISHRMAPNGITVGSNQFGFRPNSEQRDLDGTSYGLSVSLVPYVMRAILSCQDMRLATFREGLWWNHQDMYACVKESTD
jgi:SAM-dependent methyltransferase